MESSHAVPKGDSHKQQETGCGGDCISPGTKNHQLLYAGIPRIHKATSGTFSTQKHEDHIAGKGFTSMSHYNLVHKFIPMPQAMNILSCPLQKWSNEKLHLENARKLRGIHFIDRRIRNSRKPSRMLVRNWKHQLLLLSPAKL